MAEFIIPPPAHVIAGKKFWTRRGIREALAEHAEQPAPAPAPDDEYLIQSRELRHMLGGVSDMWLWRHSRRPVDAAQGAA